MKATITFGLAALVTALGCEKAAPPANDSATTTQATASTTAGASTPAKVEGRCKVTTAGVPYDMFYVYPEKNELLTRVEGAMFYRPMTVTAKTATKVEFTVKEWVDPDAKNPLRSQSASLTIAPEKWSFDFEQNTDAECTPDGFALTHKSLPDAGIPAGTWVSKADGFVLTVLSDGQRLFTKVKRKPESLIYYRILDKTDAGVVLATSATAPSTAAGDIWGTMTLSLVGAKLNLSIKGTSMVLDFDKPLPGTPADPPEPAPGASQPAPSDAPVAASGGAPPTPPATPAPAVPSESPKAAPTVAAPATASGGLRKACLQACVRSCADDASCERSCVGRCPPG